MKIHIFLLQVLWCDSHGAKIYKLLEMGDSRDHHVNRQHYLLTFAVIKRTHATNDMKCQRGRISL